MTAAGRPFGPDDTPQAVDDVEVAVFEGEAVLFHESASMVHHLGAVAGAVWMCCDGRTTVASMVDELADVFGTTTAEVEPAVHESLERFADEGLLAGHPAPKRFTLRPDPQLAEDGTEIFTPPADP